MSTTETQPKKRKVDEAEAEVKDTQENQLILYAYWRSSCSWRVRSALAIKNISYTYKSINLLKGQHNETEYSTLNPMNELPYLVLPGGRGIGQSMAICEYLEETYPTISIFPKDPYLRAKTRQLCEIITSDVQPVQNLRVLNRIENISNTEERGKWGKWVIELGFKAFEAEIAKLSGKYCVGDEVTLADICLVPQVYNARRFGVDLTPYPRIVEIDSRLSELPAFRAAHPDAQPDAVKA